MRIRFGSGLGLGVRERAEPERSGGGLDRQRGGAVVDGASSDWVIWRDGTPRAVLRRGKYVTHMMMPGRVAGASETVYRLGDDQREKAVIPVGSTVDESRVLDLLNGKYDKQGLLEWGPKVRAIDRSSYFWSRTRTIPMP